MQTIEYYLSGTPESDEALRVLVAEARGWKTKVVVRFFYDVTIWIRPDGVYCQSDNSDELPPFSTSLDATRELLADCSNDEVRDIGNIIDGWSSGMLRVILLLATARQISVAWLIVKGFLK